MFHETQGVRISTPVFTARRLSPMLECEFESRSELSFLTFVSGISGTRRRYFSPRTPVSSCPHVGNSFSQEIK